MGKEEAENCVNKIFTACEDGATWDSGPWQRGARPSYNELLARGRRSSPLCSPPRTRTDRTKVFSRTHRYTHIHIFIYRHTELPPANDAVLSFHAPRRYLVRTPVVVLGEEKSRARTASRSNDVEDRPALERRRRRRSSGCPRARASYARWVNIRAHSWCHEV